MSEIHKSENTDNTNLRSFDPDRRIEVDQRILIVERYDPDKRIKTDTNVFSSESLDSESDKMYNDNIEKNAEGNDNIGYNEHHTSSESHEVNQNDIDNQNKEISSVETGKRDLNTTQEKGNYGEMKTDADLRNKGYERISKGIVTSLDDKGHQGIDGVYHNPNGKPKYMIVDAKYGSAQLSETADGKQMSEKWIDNRLDVSVGKEKADEIRLEKILQPDNVGSYVSHIDENGNVTYDRLNEEGNVSERNVEL